MYDALLGLHGFSGFAGLFAAFVAIATRLIKTPHAVHIWSGRIFTAGMIGVGLTGFIIAFFERNAFLFSLAFFVLYLAGMGYRFAVDRSGITYGRLRFLSIAILVIFVVMAGAGAFMLYSGNSSGILMLVFGTIGLMHAIIDVRASFGASLTGRDRIAAHLARMLGGTIAALTAFLLIQFQTSSIFVWLGPAIVLTPVIFIWAMLLKKGRGLHSKAGLDAKRDETIQGEVQTR